MPGRNGSCKKLKNTIKGTQPSLLHQAMQGAALASLFCGPETWYGLKTPLWTISQIQGAISRAARAVLAVYKTNPVPALFQETRWGPAVAWLERSHDCMAVRIAAACYGLKVVCYSQNT